MYFYCVKKPPIRVEGKKEYDRLKVLNVKEVYINGFPDRACNLEKYCAGKDVYLYRHENHNYEMK